MRNGSTDDCRGEGKSGEEIPLVIDGEEITTNLWGVGRDPSRHNEVSYKLLMRTLTRLNMPWSRRTGPVPPGRPKALANALKSCTGQRRSCPESGGEAIAAMVRDAGKAPTEADVEVSEAIDFCRYYAEGLDRDGMNDGVEMSPLGTICVMSPEFPLRHSDGRCSCRPDGGKCRGVQTVRTGRLYGLADCTGVLARRCA